MDVQTQIQMINYAIVEASLNGGTRQDYRQALEFLKAKGIETIPTRRVYATGTKPINTSFLRLREKQIRTTGDIVLPPKFNGRLGPRTEKDKMYERIWALVDSFLKNERRRYIGLAGTYLPIIKKALGEDSLVVCCENNTDHYQWLKRFANNFLAGQGIVLERKDILKYICSTEISPNIIDLDLMKCMSNELADIVVNSISKIDKEVSSSVILNVVSCVGRGNTWEQHYQSMTYLKEKLQDFFWIQAETKGKYLERYHPIAYNVFVLC